MVPHGYVHVPSLARDCVRVPLVDHGYDRDPLAPHGCVRVPLADRDYVRVPLAIHDCVRDPSSSPWPRPFHQNQVQVDHIRRGYVRVRPSSLQYPLSASSY